ncbi:sigma factor [Streptomyces sp. NBC_00828]|uniref:sigma factor n=1 Tax=Streptomyces sp. NBC_00828 TaxID=2903678 RepID=UPI003863198D
MLADPVKAEDLLQSALLSTFEAWERIRSKEPEHAYVRTVMRNRRTEWWRAQKLDVTPVDTVPETGVRTRGPDPGLLDSSESVSTVKSGQRGGLASGVSQSPQPGQRRPRTGPSIPATKPDWTRPKIHMRG